MITLLSTIVEEKKKEKLIISSRCIPQGRGQEGEKNEYTRIINEIVNTAHRRRSHNSAVTMNLSLFVWKKQLLLLSSRLSSHPRKTFLLSLHSVTGCIWRVTQQEINTNQSRHRDGVSSVHRLIRTHTWKWNYCVTLIKVPDHHHPASDLHTVNEIFAHLLPVWLLTDLIFTESLFIDWCTCATQYQ